MAKCSTPLFNQQRKFQGFAFPAIFKIQEVRGREGHFVIWKKSHLFFIFQKCPAHSVQLLLDISLCSMREVPTVFINIYDTQLAMLHLLCFAAISHGFKSFCAQSTVIMDIWNGILARGAKTFIAIVLWVCLKNLHRCKSKYRYFFSWRRRKKTWSVSVHMKKHFKTENTACKEERGKCVILNGKNSCLGQIETRWERKNQKSQAETHSGKRHQRRNVLTSQRTGNSQTFFPVVLDHMAHRNMEETLRRTHQVIWGTGPKNNPVTPRMAGCLHQGGAELGVFSEETDRNPRNRRTCLCVLIQPHCWGK